MLLSLKKFVYDFSLSYYYYRISFLSIRLSLSSVSNKYIIIRWLRDYVVIQIEQCYIFFPRSLL